MSREVAFAQSNPLAQQGKMQTSNIGYVNYLKSRVNSQTAESSLRDKFQPSRYSMETVLLTLTKEVAGVQTIAISSS